MNSWHSVEGFDISQGTGCWAGMNSIAKEERADVLRFTADMVVAEITLSARACMSTWPPESGTGSAH